MLGGENAHLLKRLAPVFTSTEPPVTEGPYMCGDSTTCACTTLRSAACHVTPVAAAAWLDMCRCSTA